MYIIIFELLFEFIDTDVIPEYKLQFYGLIIIILDSC